MNELIAVIDDETYITGLISLHLTRSNFKVKEFHDAQSFYAFLRDEIPDLLILDLMLPDADGLEVCKHLKSKINIHRFPLSCL